MTPHSRMMLKTWLPPFSAAAAFLILTAGSSSKTAAAAAAAPFQCKGKGCLVVDHSLWDSLLKECVLPRQQKNGIYYNAVDYQKLEATKKAELKEYLEILASTDVHLLSHEEALAFMINAYNAFTVDVIVENNPRKSIRDLSSFFRGSVFKRFKHKLNFGGVEAEVSLDDVEHKYIREMITKHQDPRVHSGVNCASISCPDLRPEAYTGTKINEQLDEQMRIWMSNEEKGAKVVGSTVYLSPIFSWFKEDFQPGMLDVASKYAPEEISQAIKYATHIRYFGYDWDLNKVYSS